MVEVVTMQSPSSNKKSEKKSSERKKTKSKREKSSKRQEKSPNTKEQSEKHVTVPEIYERPKVGETVVNKFNVIKELGEGGFGVVLEVVDQISSEHYAMKVELETPPEDEPGLELEGAVLKRLLGYAHILRFIDEGKHGEFTFLVMQLAGHNLSDLRKHCPQQRFTNSTTVRVAIQCLEAIETVHVAGFLHRDVKPANFAMGFTEQDKGTVYILDFGLVRRFRLKNGKVRPQRKTAGFRGSYQYASVNAHRNVDLGRCDDIWSWLYSVIQMRVGRLPWRKLNGKTKIGNSKADTPKDELLKEMEPEFHKIYDNLVTLRYEDEPPFGKYREHLTKIIKRKNYSSDAPYDWEEGGKHYKHTVYVKPEPYAEQVKDKDD